jgi:hypothetical protein
LFKTDEIKALGFAWPHPDVPGQYLVMEKNDLINLKESIEKEIGSDNLFAICRFPLLLCPGHGSPSWNPSKRNNLPGTILSKLPR